jgi:hypothetical protein
MTEPSEKASRAGSRREGARIWFVLLAILLTVCLLAIPPWREHTVYQALVNSRAPSFWWPPSWRRELETSLLLEGQVKPPTAGTLELVSEPEGRVFRTAVTAGRYSFLPRLLPAGPFKVRCLSPDGTATRWLMTGPLDPGFHRINFSF